MDSPAAAPRLLGWALCRYLPQGTIKVRIVEVEAYHQDDAASHSYRGSTKRTWPMFETGGHLYVYFTYGMHYALNIVTGPAGVGEGVLIRAAEPLEGIEIMRANRGIEDIDRLAKGPGCLTQALGITDTALSGKILNPAAFTGASAIRLPAAPALKSNGTRKFADIWLEPPAEKIEKSYIIAGPRVGIRRNADAPWRFYLKDSSFVSRI